MKEQPTMTYVDVADEVVDEVQAATRTMQQLTSKYEDNDPDGVELIQPPASSEKLLDSFEDGFSGE